MTRSYGDGHNMGPEPQAIDGAFSSHNIEKELDLLKQRTRLGYEVNVEWLPDTIKYQNGKKLVEEVSGDTIFIYTENPDEALEMVKHGFAEWMLNQHTKPYRQLINKLIELFEEQQYERKEETVEAIVRLFADRNLGANVLLSSQDC